MLLAVRFVPGDEEDEEERATKASVVLGLESTEWKILMSSSSLIPSLVEISPTLYSLSLSSSSRAQH